MTISIAELVSQVREEVGGPPEKEIGEEVILRHVGDGISEVSRYVPNRAIYSLTLREGVSEYTPETGVVDILTVFPYVQTSLAEIFGSEFDVYLGMDLMFDWEMSQYNRLVDYLNRTQVHEVFSWDFNLGTQLLRLMPPPTISYEGKKAYYVGVKDWNISTLPARLKRLVVRYATAQILPILARYRSRLTSPTRTGTSVDYQLSNQLLKDGQESMDSWREEVLAEERRWFWM